MLLHKLDLSEIVDGAAAAGFKAPKAPAFCTQMHWNLHPYPVPDRVTLDKLVNLSKSQLLHLHGDNRVLCGLNEIMH